MRCLPNGELRNGSDVCDVIIDVGAIDERERSAVLKFRPDQGS